MGRVVASCTALFWLLAAPLSLGSAGCGGGGGASTGGGGAGATAQGGGGAGGAGAKGGGGAGAQGGGGAAQGGGGAGGGLVCTPGAVEACYTGPAGTLGVGSCAAGTATCSADGTVLGPCVGEVLPAAESCSTPDDEDCDGAPGCSGNHLWSKRFGDAGNQWTEGIATDANGNVLVSGAFEGTVDFGGGPLTSAGNWDVFVAKLAP